VKLGPTLLLRLFGLTKIPMLFFASPSVLELNDEGCAVKIPLTFRTRNHVGSIYLGAMVAGADLASGLNALMAIRRSHPRVVLVFKNLEANFLKRADGDAVFRCRQGAQIVAAVAQADAGEDRATLPVHIEATVPSKYGDEPVATFTLGLSLKRKN
jgi:hypothetical protein